MLPPLPPPTALMNNTLSNKQILEQILDVTLGGTIVNTA